MKLQKESPAGFAGKVNRVKEIRRRGKDGLKINQSGVCKVLREEGLTQEGVAGFIRGLRNDRA